MDEDKQKHYIRRIRKFVFTDEADEVFINYYKANGLTQEEGEQIRQGAERDRLGIVKKSGTRKLILGLLIIGVAITVFFMTKEMEENMKKNLNYCVYGGVAIGSIFFSSGLIYLLVPGHSKGAVDDPKLLEED